MIKSIFYARFHPERGTEVLHQVPEGSIKPTTPDEAAQSLPLVDFPQIADFIIPRQELCDRLVTVCNNGCRVVGYPICIADRARYDRNEFMFNMAFVLDENCEIGAYASVVRKLARVLRNLEEQGGFLSRDQEEHPEQGPAVPENIWNSVLNGAEEIPEEGDSGEIRDDSLDLVVKAAFSRPRTTGGSKVYALCEMILEDLNNYCECMIPIDDSNTINLKLFPQRPAPAPIHSHHVPLLTIPLPTATAPHSQSPFLPVSSASLDLDLTLLRLLPQITGTQTVAQLAHNADVDLSLARKAIAHLLYYGCIVLLDVFQYGAVYAPTAQIGAIVEDEALQRECSRYVAAPWSSSDGLRGSRRFPARGGAAFGTSPGNSGPNEWWDAVASASQPGSGPASYREKLPYMRTRTTSPSPGATPSPGRTPAHSRNPSNVPGRSVASFLGGGRSLDGTTLITLYTTLRQGLPLRAWCLENSVLLVGIDVRRLITFGVIKGLLYRVHRYAIATGPTHLSGHDDAHVSQRPYHGHGPSRLPSDAGYDRDERDFAIEAHELPLSKYLDGNHSFDQICTDLEMGEKEVMSKLKGFGEVHIVNR